MKNSTHRAGVCALLLLVAPAAARAQVQSGPITPPAKREVKRIPMETAAEIPPIPAEEIVRRFVAREDSNRKAFDAASFQFSVRVQEYGEDGKGAGEAQYVSEIYFKEDGKRYGRVVSEPPSTLKRASTAIVDLQGLAQMPYFPLTSDQLDKFDLTYAGREQVDEIGTFIFRVKPRQVDRRERRFEGVVWVDDQEFEIVKSYGRFLTDVASDEPFQLFETYREPVGEKLRLPTYVRCDGILKIKTVANKTEDVPLRLTIRFMNYKLPAEPAK